MSAAILVTAPASAREPRLGRAQAEGQHRDGDEQRGSGGDEQSNASGPGPAGGLGGQIEPGRGLGEDEVADDERRDHDPEVIGERVDRQDSRCPEHESGKGRPHHPPIDRSELSDETERQVWLGEEEEEGEGGRGCRHLDLQLAGELEDEQGRQGAENEADVAQERIATADIAGKRPYEDEREQQLDRQDVRRTLLPVASTSRGEARQPVGGHLSTQPR